VFGNALSNTQVMTGSVGITGSLAVAGAATVSSSISAGGYIVGAGTNPGGLGGSKYILDHLSGVMRIFSYGVNNTTNGGFLLNSQRSDGTNSLDFLSISASGSVRIPKITVTYTDYGKSINSTLSLATAGGLYEANLINFGYDSETWQPAYMGYTCTSGAGSSNGALIFGTRDVTTNTQPTERMRITASGSVGIGVSAPRSILEVQKTTGNTSLGVASNALLLLSQGGILNELSQILFGYTVTTSPAVISYKTTDAAAYTKGALIFATRDVTTDTAPTERMSISSTGAVELTSTSPKITFTPSGYAGSYRTVLGARGGADGVLQLGNNNPNYIVGGNTGTGGSLHFYVNATSDFITSTNGTLALVLDSTGAATFSASVTSTGFAVANTGGSINTSDIGAYVSLFGATGSPANTVIIGTASTEKMRITSGGVLCMGTTAVTINEERLSLSGTGNTATIRTTTAGGSCILLWNSATSGNNSFLEFGTDGGFSVRGSITYNRGSAVVAYNTTSDYRLKSEINDFNALEIVSNLKPKEFRIGDAINKSLGFIAHELQEYLPQAVQGEKDAVNKDGNPMYQGVDYSQLTGLLTKAIQELSTKLDEATTRIKTLESK
jgi:hypothetical protein